LEPSSPISALDGGNLARALSCWRVERETVNERKDFQPIFYPLVDIVDQKKGCASSPPAWRRMVMGGEVGTRRRRRGEKGGDSFFTLEKRRPCPCITLNWVRNLRGGRPSVYFIPLSIGKGGACEKLERPGDHMVAASLKERCTQEKKRGKGGKEIVLPVISFSG